jgi:hypothetical protein
MFMAPQGYALYFNHTQGYPMWLLYLRFDDNGVAKTYHVRTGSKRDVQDFLTMAEKHGLTASEKLVEYAAFSVSGTIKLKPMLVPNFHFYDHYDFLARWQAVDAGG